MFISIFVGLYLDIQAELLFGLAFLPFFLHRAGYQVLAVLHILAEIVLAQSKTQTKLALSTYDQQPALMVFTTSIERARLGPEILFLRMHNKHLPRLINSDFKICLYEVQGRHHHLAIVILDIAINILL